MSFFTKRLKQGIIIFLILGVLATKLFAESPKEKPTDKPNDALVFLIVEGTFAAYSGCAVASPKITGIVTLVTLPIGVGTAEPTPGLAEGLTIGIGFAGLAVYNIIVPKQKDLSDKTIFARNMIGIHAIALTGLAVQLTSDWLFPSKTAKNTDWNMDLALKDGEPLLVVSYKF